MSAAIVKEHTVSTKYWRKLSDGKLQCDLCPRGCQLQEGQRGLCFVRARQNDEIVLATHGRSSGFCVDPIEKKPLNHFLPGSAVLSFGTAGCNLTCKFCQNWSISKSREIDTLGDQASPLKIAQTAKRLGCSSVAFTYNDPIIFMEYALDVAQACREFGINSVAVSAGYICEEPRRDFFPKMDAANIDLKGFTEDFYRRICGAELGPVLDTLRFLKHETDTWFEITTLLIPGQNDSNSVIESLCSWVAQELGPEVPLHFSAFHPDFKMKTTPRTPVSTLNQARHIGLEAGLQYVYTGNVHNQDGDTTFCASCGEVLIARDWYQILDYRLDKDGQCNNCGAKCAGVFTATAGDWGPNRLPISIGKLKL